jgi:hypothetical protein
MIYSIWATTRRDLTPKPYMLHLSFADSITLKKYFSEKTAGNQFVPFATGHEGIVLKWQFCL